MAVWSPIAHFGLPKSATFSLHFVGLLDAGVVSSQPTACSGGDLSVPLLWTRKSFCETVPGIADGYQVESYNFSNIPNVVSIQWAFRVLVTKVDNGQPVYEDLSPPYDRPVFPIDGKGFLANIRIDQSYRAQWFGNVANIYPLQGTAIWNFAATVSSSEAHLPAYPVSTERVASVLMTIRNGTALSATVRFFVHTNDFAPVTITYRSISVETALNATVALAVTDSALLLVAFGQQASKSMRRILRRNYENEDLAS